MECHSSTWFSIFMDRNFRKQRVATFILTVVCNATRYLHALPLKNQRSETVANELLRLFSFIGFPKSIKSDWQSSLNPQLMMTLHSLLGIKSEFSTPYHHVPLAERSNQTIGNMIKSFIRSCPRSWDDLLGYLCFAHNQLINPVLGEAPATYSVGETINWTFRVASEYMDGGWIWQTWS